MGGGGGDMGCFYLIVCSGVFKANSCLNRTCLIPSLHPPRTFLGGKAKKKHSLTSRWTNPEQGYSWFRFYFGATPGGVRGLLLALYTGITPGSARGSYEMTGIEPGPDSCKANILPAVLSLRPYQSTFIGVFLATVKQREGYKNRAFF